MINDGIFYTKSLYKTKKQSFSPFLLLFFLEKTL